MKNTPLAKFAALGGALLGIALKVNDFLRVKILRCGIGTANECGITDYLKDTLIWIVIMITLALIVVFGIKYLYIYGKDAWKSRKHTKHKPAKTVKERIKKRK